MKDKLTSKQLLWCEHYLQTWNATQAARLAGYRGDDNALGVVGHRNLRKAKIKVYIDRRLQEVTLKSDEVLMRLSQQATASLSDFVKPIGNLFMIDMDKVIEKGHLVKKLKYNHKAGVEIELYDSQSALVHIGRHYALFSDKLQIEDWRSEVIRLLKEGGLDLKDVINDLGIDLAEELFAAAGVSVSQGSQSHQESQET